MDLILAALIIYGFVLIVVRGSIFHGPRTAFFTFVANYEKQFTVEKEQVLDMLLSGSQELDISHKNLFDRLQIQIINTQIPEDIEKLTKLTEELIEKIRSKIEIKRNSIVYKKVFLWTLLKLQKLVQCSMCLGFWAGIVFSVLTLFYPIVLFGVIIQPVDVGNPLYVFCYGLLTAGVTWAIDQFVDFFSEGRDFFQRYNP